MAEQISKYKTIGKPMTAQEKMEYMKTAKFPFLDDYRNYEKIKKIGQGTFGEVWKAKNRLTNEVVAMKKILDDNETQGFPITAMREIRILKRVKNENIVRMKDVVTDRVFRKDRVQCIHYLIFEFCEHDLAGLLSDRKLRFCLAEIKALIKQLLLGLHYLHYNNMLHRDMKSSNVLVNKDGVLKLADFGLSRPFSDKRPEPLTNRVVTLWYRPPELLLGERLYTPKIDIWGAGCIMAEMWTRVPILQGNTEQMQLTFISRLCGSITPQVWPDVQGLPLFSTLKLEHGNPRKLTENMKNHIKDPHACDLLDKLLILDPAKRFDANSALDHDFFFTDPMPCTMEQLKIRFSKINVSMFDYFTNRRPNPHQQQQQQQHRPGQQVSQQRPPQQQQQPRHSSNMADSNYIEPVF